jgi:hypothetical protein
MMEALPGGLFKSPLSDATKNYFRNVEAVGSNPITSTKAQVNGLNVGSPLNQTDR